MFFIKCGGRMKDVIVTARSASEALAKLQWIELNGFSVADVTTSDGVRISVFDLEILAIETPILLTPT